MGRSCAFKCPDGGIYQKALSATMVVLIVLLSSTGASVSDWGNVSQRKKR
ncbi:MAG: hypothetical protein ACLU77_05850 [Waltera sp.]